MIDDIAINLWYSWNFSSMKNVIRICNPMVSVGSQIVAHTQMEIGDGPNKPNTINL